MTSVKYGDTVFVLLPQLEKSRLFTSISDNIGGFWWKPWITTVIPYATSNTIEQGDPYVIDPVGKARVGDDLKPGSRIRIRRMNDTDNKVMVDVQFPKEVSTINIPADTLTLQNLITNNSIWTIAPTNPNDGPTITWGRGFRLVNLATGRTAGYFDYNLVTMGTSTSSTTVFTFGAGPYSAAQLQCCRNKFPLATPDYCGNFRGTLCNGYCDDILTNYCAKVAMNDPECGCMLPASYYDQNKILGPPECIDNRCVDHQAYKRKDQCNPHCKIINCVIAAQNVNTKGSHISHTVFNQECGNVGPRPPPGPTPSNGGGGSDIGRWILFGVGGLVLLAVIAFVIFMLLSSGKKSKVDSSID